MNQDGGYIALRGFKYQFDKTILQIFSQAIDVSIEQLQDLGYDDYIVQVKYHDTDYTVSQQKAKKKEPILQLLGEHQKDPAKRYVLFIYLKGVAAAKYTLNLAALDDILGSAAAKFDREVRAGFCQRFELVHSVNFSQQYREVLSAIMSAFNVKIEVAEIYYMMISSHLLRIVVDHPAPNVHKRLTNRLLLKELISKSQQLIFRSQYAQQMGRDRYCEWMKRNFFKSGMNREAYERVFIIEANQVATIRELKSIVLYIKSRWSHNSRSTIPDKERFVPYIFFRNVTEESLVVMKRQLLQEGFKIKDGYDYKGADFNVHSIMEMPNFHNKLLFKIVNDESALKEVIASPSRTKELYEFYLTNPASLIYPTIKHIQIEVENIAEILNIA